MSIQTHINGLCNTILYRVQNLNRFTDYIFIEKEIFNKNPEKIPIFFDSKHNTYELCDLIYSIEPTIISNNLTSSSIYDKILMLLILCPEHEVTRELCKINI